MKLLLVLTVLTLSITSCTKEAVCDNAKKVTAVAGPLIAAAGECEVPGEIDKWLNEVVLWKVGLCPKIVPTGPLGEDICPIAFDAIAAAARGGLPAAAKCHKVPGEDALKKLIMPPCLKI